MFCSFCGKKIAENSKFCKYCGASQIEVGDIEEKRLNKKEKINIKNPLIIWILSIVVFLISLYFGGVRNGSFVDNPSPAKNFAMILLSLSVFTGFLSFMIMVFRLIDLGMGKKEVEKKNKLKTIFIFLITLPIYPVYLLISTIKSFKLNKPKFKDIRWLILLVNFIVIVPVWAVAYNVVYSVATDELFLGLRYQIGHLNEMNSMAPSFPGNSIYKYYPYKNIIYKIDKNKAYKFQRGDVVAFSNETTRKAEEIMGVKPYSFLKRVIAIPGDTVEIKGGGVFVNGKYLEEPYVEKPNSTFPLKEKYDWFKKNNLDGLFLEECQKVTVPENSLFVLGDRRENSDDSRTMGFISIDDVEHYLPYKEQQETYYEGVNPLNHSEKWRNTAEDYINLEKSGLIKCKTN